jgi:methionyl-tRNA formyltransferase
MANPTSALRLVLMGSPALAIPGFAALVEAGHHIAAVYTQPDKPAGRGRRLQACPVAQWARAQGHRIEQPETFRKSENRRILSSFEADALVVTAYGRILPRGVLAIPRLGAVNLHASLLPRWRGASPIQAAIAAGDVETGLTTMLMDAGVDTGPTLLHTVLPIGAREDSVSLGQRLAAVSGPLLVRTLAGLAHGNIEPRPQPEEGVTLAPILRREDGALSWSEEAGRIDKLVRAYRPWPGVSLPVAAGRLKILEAEVAEPGGHAHGPGQLVGVQGTEATVRCGRGALRLLRVQAPSRKPVTGGDYVRGARLGPGDPL